MEKLSKGRHHLLFYSYMLMPCLHGAAATRRDKLVFAMFDTVSDYPLLRWRNFASLGQPHHIQYIDVYSIASLHRTHLLLTTLLDSMPSCLGHYFGTTIGYNWEKALTF